jgi:hypothetical protein
MIPPLSIDIYPPNTLEGHIARRWVKRIEEWGALAPRVGVGMIEELIRESRAAMCAAKWTPAFQHLFLRQLRNDLTALTEGHILTRQFIEVLDREQESN